MNNEQNSEHAWPIQKLSPDEFPALLREMSDPPKQLYLRGTLSTLEQSGSPGTEPKILCVVGSRKYSEYGKEACEYLIEGLQGYPITIVSGLALGIDSVAHRAALEARLTTLAFPGSGLQDDVLYPAIHYRLAQEILNSGGTLLSEFKPDQRAAPWMFPRRNRLMAGIAHAVLIIEAEERSGTSITARLALDYNRDVFVVPGSIFSPGSAGPHKLLQEGAAPVTCPEDILIKFGLLSPEDKQSVISFKKSSDGLLTPEEKIIMTLLDVPLQRDLLLKKSRLSVDTFQQTISRLELKQVLTEIQGMYYKRL